jgi:hypothetical protein
MHTSCAAPPEATVVMSEADRLSHNDLGQGPERSRRPFAFQRGRHRLEHLDQQRRLRRRVHELLFGPARELHGQLARRAIGRHQPQRGVMHHVVVRHR